MSSQENKPRHDHERTDWDLRYVLTGLLAVVISVVLILVASWWIFRVFYNWAADRQMGTARVTEQESTPPEPRLQISPDRDWEEMLKREQSILNSYRWVDRSHGVIHIPIDRAMEIVAQRGLRNVQPEGGRR